MIKTNVIGHLGKDAIINNVNNQTVINFSVAHSETYINAAGQQMNNTIWINCSFWTERTRVAEYLKKGQLVYVEGKPSVDSYTNKDRVTIPQLRLRVDNIQLLGGKKSDEVKPVQQEPTRNTAFNANDITEPIDDLPF